MAKIMCISCKYAKEDRSASMGGWTAYECVNDKSEYHKALLNVGLDGERQKRISWRGCEFGQRRGSDEALSETGI